MFLAAFESLVEERIQKAMDEGQFRNLPGEGKPINLSDYDFLNPDVWMSNKILKNAGYLPPWVELAWDIDADERRVAAISSDYDTWLAASRARLLPLSRLDRIDHRAALDNAFHAHIERYVRHAEPLHEKIVNFNVMCPIHRLEKVNIWVDHLVERMEGRYAELCDELGWAAPQPRPVTLTRKEAARNRAESRARHVLDLVRSAAELRAIVQPARIVPRTGPGARWWSLLRPPGK